MDLSYIVRARTYDRGFPQFLLDAFIPYAGQGADYLFALLTGYLPDDPQLKANRYYPGGVINMPKTTGGWRNRMAGRNGCRAD